MFKNIFGIKKDLAGLEKAKELGLITELEFLRLKKDRALEELRIYEAKKTKKKK